jgi:hypothetical protein
MSDGLINVLLIGGWLGSVLVCLVWLARSSVRGTERALWALMIVLVPILGAAAFVIVARFGPGRSAGPG